jgi:hypothetical protein
MSLIAALVALLLLPRKNMLGLSRRLCTEQIRSEDVIDCGFAVGKSERRRIPRVSSRAMARLKSFAVESGKLVRGR